tara:strand:+ start:256 stop:474 length:219 start_codon:yes stop_codon:yes gene_type:complete
MVELLPLNVMEAGPLEHREMVSFTAEGLLVMFICPCSAVVKMKRHRIKAFFISGMIFRGLVAIPEFLLRTIH